MISLSETTFYTDLERHGDKTALLAEDLQPLSYAGLAALADRKAAPISGRSLALILASNHPGCFAAYLGMLRKGVVPILMNHSIAAPLFARFLEIYRPEYVFLPERRSDLPDGRLKAIDSGDGHVLYGNTAGARHELHDDLALVLTTSGSTGSPKLVRLSRGNLVSNAEAIAEYLGIAPDDRAVTTLPAAYSYGLSILHSHWARGASVAVTERTLLDREFWNFLKASRATTFGGVPYSYEILKKLRFAKMTLPDLRYTTQAGGRLAPELVAEFRDIAREKGRRFIVMYGQTEATARMSYLPWEHSFEKPASIGIAVPGGRFELHDDSGRIVAEHGMPGELVYFGENVFLGYADSPEDFRLGNISRGRLDTGDVAVRDKDGFYSIVGRKKRFLKVFGNRINLDEVDALLTSAGFDAVCTGEDDRIRVFVTQAGRTEEARTFLAESLNLNPVAFEACFLPEIPRNASGKVAYDMLPKR